MDMDQSSKLKMCIAALVSYLLGLFSPEGVDLATRIVTPLG